MNQIIQDLENMHLPVPQSGSNCKPDSAPAPQAPPIARNALCPCRSGEKYKRCCGKTAPPLLGKAA
jgi:uncharacterized protein YecA (UPF0149 family)